MQQTLKRPEWAHKKISLGSCAILKTALREAGVRTVCEEALCPNMGECFAKGEATILILGPNCTRKCTFCSVKRLAPMPFDPNEPERVAAAVKKLSLSHVVITSVTRDDLDDGGAEAFCRTVRAVRAQVSGITIELLIPDFNFNKKAIEAVIKAKPDILAHNIETVPSLYPMVREGADYQRSLNVLTYIKGLDAMMLTKSGLMLGMGEGEEEILSAMKDIAGTGCDFLSIGQYLAPSKQHFPVKKYITPEKFAYFKERALGLGFKHVESGTFVRSSYRAGEYLKLH